MEGNISMKIDFKRNARKWSTLIIAIVSYFLIHEGAHLIYAFCIGVFKQINIIGIGIQIDVYAERMTDTQMGIFCIVGAAATITVAYIILALTGKIIKSKSVYFRAIMYYIVFAFLLIDPLYLSVIYSFVGGGDMNGIMLLMPETAARILFGIIAVINIILFIKIALPKYNMAYKETNI